MKTINTKVVILALLLSVPTLSSCTAWEALTSLSGGGPHLSNDMTFGDKKQTVATDISGKKQITNNTAHTVYNTYQTMNKQSPWWIILLMILGWTLPQPSTLLKRFTGIWRKR